MSSSMRKIIFFMALVGMVYLGWAHMITPANAALAKQKIELQKNKAKLAELEKEKANTKNLDQQVKQMEEAIHFFENKLPHQSQIHRVLSQMSDIISRCNLEPKTNKTKKLKQYDGYVELPLKMELEGSFNSFYEFLLELERLDRITKIKEFKIKSKKNAPGRIVAEFTMSIFFHNNKK